MESGFLPSHWSMGLLQNHSKSLSGVHWVGKTQRSVPDSYLANLKGNERPTGTSSDDRVKRKGCRWKSWFPLKMRQRQSLPCTGMNSTAGRQVGTPWWTHSAWLRCSDQEVYAPEGGAEKGRWSAGRGLVGSPAKWEVSSKRWEQCWRIQRRTPQEKEPLPEDTNAWL